MRWSGRSVLWIVICVTALLLTAHAFASGAGSNLPVFDTSAVLRPENRATYQIIIQDAPHGTIDIYNHPTGAFVPIEPLLQQLGYRYTRDDNDKLLQINFPDQTSLTLRFAKEEYISGGNTETLQSSDFIFSGPDIFLNYELLNKTFPVGFSLDQAAGKLRVIAKDNTPSPATATATALSPPPDDFPVPQAAPRLPVVVDDAAGSNPPAAAPQTEASTAAANKPAPPPMATPPPSATTEEPEDKGGNEEEVLVLQPKIKHDPPMDQFIEAVGVGDRLYLPLADMMKMLEFDIKVDEAAGTAEGSFISPEHDFSLNMKTRQLRVNRTDVTLNDDSLHTHDGKIYINAVDFAAWFDIHCSYDRKFMTLAIETDIALPVETRNERHALWNKLLMSQGAAAKTYQPIENPYQLATIPFVDVNLSTGYSSADEHHTSGVYTILGAGDLGYLTTDIYAAGSDQNPLDNLRFTAGRKDPDAGLLGPLQATAFSMGDIDSPSLNLVTNNSLGRGVSVTNRALNAPDNFDTHTITGNAVPGWEVELYRNNLLLGFQTVDSNGRYEFLNEPLIYGANSFRVVLYGPQGQTEDRVENIAVGSTMLKPGQVEYTFSANQEAASMLQFDSINGSTASAANSPEGLRTVGETRYGIADFLTLGAGAAETDLPDGYHQYATMTADTSFAGIYSEANFIKDLNNGFVGGVTALTSIYDISIRALHRQYHDFTSEVETLAAPDDFRKAVSEIDLNSQVYVPLLQDFSVGASALYETFTAEVPKTTYTASVAKTVLGMSFSNSINYIIDDQKQLEGDFGWQTRIDNIMLRADGTYDIDPQFGLHDAALTAQYRLTDDVSAQSQVDQKLGDDKHTTFTQTFNQDMENYRLSLSSQVNDQMQYVFGLSIVFSIAHDGVTDRWHTRGQSLAGSGAIAPRIFVDDNYNGKYDEGEKIVPDAAVRIDSVPAPAREDKDFIAPVNAYQPVNVDVDVSTIQDPLLSPAIDGYRVTTRPGDVVTLDFPLVATSEIDGTVSVVDDKGGRYEIPDIVVELDDAHGKSLKRVASESDGYYVFEKVRPGDYTITIPPEALAQYHAELALPIHIKIDKVTDFRSGNDLVLKATGPLPPNLTKWEK